jgi:KTSC domain
MVRMQPVESSSVRAIGYDEEAEELWVEFYSSPDPYVYLEVPPQIYSELKEAGSKGEYVNLVIKPCYDYEHRRRPVRASRAKRRRG